MREPGEEEGAAAPGKKGSKWREDNSVQEAEVKVLVGQHKPNYLSQVNLTLQKNDSGTKVKPFIKLNFAYDSPEKAKQMEGLFK